jgi:DNA polymerase IV
MCERLPEAVQLARIIKERIREETGLTASAGVSFNKLLSKLGSDAHKRDGLTLITLEQATAFLDSLPVEKFFGVGGHRGCAQKAWYPDRGRSQQMSEEQLRELLGSGGSFLYQYVRAEDERFVE